MVRFDSSAKGLPFNKAIVYVSRVGFMLDRLMAYAGQKGYLTGELQMHQLRVWFSTVRHALIAGGAATESDFVISANGADRPIRWAGGCIGWSNIQRNCPASAG